jgi:hypothetical protein
MRRKVRRVGRWEVRFWSGLVRSETWQYTSGDGGRGDTPPAKRLRCKAVGTAKGSVGQGPAELDSTWFDIAKRPQGV